MIKNHILGALYGMAIGDAMGMPSELLSRRKIKELFGKIDTFLDSPPENPAAIGLKKGEFTDDTAQALIIIDSLIENNFIPDTKIIATNLIHWAKKTDAFSKNILGPSTKNALNAIQKGEDPEQYTSKAVTNGAAMRIPPIGCLFSTDSLEAMVQYITKISETTHKTDVAIAGASMVASAVSAAIEKKSWDEIMNIAIKSFDLACHYGYETFSASLKARLILALDLAKKYSNSPNLFDQSIYEVIGTTTLMSEAVPSAIAMAYHYRDPKTCSIACANLGGDTDTIGAMATAICGAAAGIEKIDNDTIKLINTSNSVDLHQYADILLARRNTIKI